MAQKKVFLEPFFKVTGGDRAEIALRYLDIPEPALCARRHWEMRSELTCRKGHSLIKVTDASNLICTCFACNDSDSNGYYQCVQCSAFQVCADCMVHAAQPEPEAAPPAAKKARRLPRPSQGPPRGSVAGCLVSAAVTGD